MCIFVSDYKIDVVGTDADYCDYMNSTEKGKLLLSITSDMVSTVLKV